MLPLMRGFYPIISEQEDRSSHTVRHAKISFTHDRRNSSKLLLELALVMQTTFYNPLAFRSCSEIVPAISRA